MSKEIKKKLRLISETVDTKHLVERLVERLNRMTDEDINTNTRQRILNNLELVKGQTFPMNKSFAILLGGFKINPESELYKNVNGREYYSIIDLFGKDSTGDQIWVVVRGNTIVTFMLRKRIQSSSPEFVEQKVRVDKAIFNIEKYIKNLPKDSEEDIQQT